MIQMLHNICHELRKRGKRSRANIGGIQPRNLFDAPGDDICITKRELTDHGTQKTGLALIAFNHGHSLAFQDR